MKTAGYILLFLVLFGTVSNSCGGTSAAQKRECGNEAVALRQEAEELFGHPGADYSTLVELCLERES